jgi:N4-gp56 family major capsid protein
VAGTVTTSTVNYAQAAYDLLARFALRPQLFFDAIADVKPTNQSMVGASVSFAIQNDLAIVTTALPETSDITPVAATDSSVVVTLAEYGSGLVTTAKLRGTSYVLIDPIMANIIGYNAGVSQDSIAGNVLAASAATQASESQQWYSAGGSGVVPTNGYVGALTSPGAMVATDIISAECIRTMYAQLYTNNVAPIDGGSYVAYIDPSTAADLRSETGNASWVIPHQYQDATPIWTGEMGTFEGFRFIVTPRSPFYSGAGAGSINIYGSLFMGAQALAKAWSTVDGNSEQPHIVPGPVTDYLRRFVPLGWYWFGGYSLYRYVALQQLYTASSLGSNIIRPTIDQS